MEEVNPYAPPESKLPQGGGQPVLWLVLWIVGTLIFCTFIAPPDPLASMLTMGFGLASFGLGSLFARAIPR